ncbi:MAG: DNA polymerase III subunit delta' [Parcubacteria group bacterium]|nr:MAG: DNA polymerase III subunit delta' [Parcubacteria group bacterium]
METMGHQKQREFLKKAIKRGIFSHAYLFSGQEKLGKKKIALEAMSLLLGIDAEKQHPDLMTIEPIEGEVKISQIRDLILWLSLRPYSAQFKGAIINSAQLMNQDAQTALLKTLEEPKGKTILILISENSDHLLPAILSRVQTIKFYPVAKEEIKKYLKGQNVPEKKAEEIAKISLGRPGEVVEHILDPKKLEFFEEKIKELNNISKSELSLRFQWAKDLSENCQGIKETLDIWTIYFRNALMEKIVPSGSGADPSGAKKIKKILNLIQSTRLLILTTNASVRLALETLMLEL